MLSLDRQPVGVAAAGTLPGTRRFRKRKLPRRLSYINCVERPATTEALAGDLSKFPRFARSRQHSASHVFLVAQSEGVGSAMGLHNGAGDSDLTRGHYRDHRAACALEPIERGTTDVSGAEQECPDETDSPQTYPQAQRPVAFLAHFPNLRCPAPKRLLTRNIPAALAGDKTAGWGISRP